MRFVLFVDAPRAHRAAQFEERVTAGFLWRTTTSPSRRPTGGRSSGRLTGRHGRPHCAKQVCDVRLHNGRHTARPGGHRRPPAQAGTDRLRLRPDPRRRPLPAGLLRDPGRQEGRHLRDVPGPRRGLLRRSRHRPHGTGDDRQRPGPTSTPCATYARRSAPGRSPSGRTARGRTARSTPQPDPGHQMAYRQVFTSNAERAAALAPWIEHYSTQRRHSALGGLPPISRLAPT